MGTIGPEPSGALDKMLLQLAPVVLLTSTLNVPVVVRTGDESVAVALNV